MRRTLLLTALLPAVLIAAAANAPTNDPGGPTSSLTSSQGSLQGSLASTSESTTTPTTPPPSTVAGDTSDGADPADPPLPSVAGDLEEDQASTSDPSSTLVSDEGFLIAPGSSVVGTGPRWRYTVEVEPATDLDLEAILLDVARSLGDTRSWSSTRTLERVDDPSAARIRLVVATPDTVDRLCGEVGLQTAGIYSCWTGRFAALNAWRWDEGAEGFDDILMYRHYLVNHEFGHGLGYGHVGCPSDGSLAPVMMQQSKGLDGCTANGWPYP